MLLWLVLAAGPWLSCLDRRPWLAAAVSICYGLGWAAMRAALSRDPRADQLRLFARSGIARLWFWLLGIAVAVVAYDSTLAGWLDFMVATGSVLLVMWWANPQASQLRLLGQRCLLMLASTMVMVGLAEAAMRLPAVVKITGGNTPGTRLFKYEDMESCNIDHLRTLHLTKDKDPGTFRIVTLGDSYTWGTAIAKVADIWPYVVERRLAELTGLKVEVINLGLSGFTTVNEAEMLRRLGWQFHPDLVLVDFTLNDTLPSGPNFYFELEQWCFKLQPLCPVYSGWLDQHSYLYSHLSSRWSGWQMQHFYPEVYGPLFDDSFSGWIDCQAALMQMGQAAREHHAGILLAVFPAFRDNLDDASYPFKEVHEKVMQAARKAGIEALDLRPSYLQIRSKGRSWWALPCDAHPSVEGQRVAGEAIVAELLRRGLVPLPKDRVKARD